MSVCGFTGYRYEKLPFSRRDGCAIELLKEKLRSAAIHAIDRGCTHFICGFAQGSDLLFAEIVDELRYQYENITMEAALPFTNPHLGWCLADQRQYETLLARCDFISTLYPQRTKGCYFERNDYILENSDYLIAVFNGKPGGTAYTVEQAARREIPTEIIAP